ncbi:hypothetical protein [Amycolatopsis sacchari]|uniref:hypothetical protein n=1 Tax=Amycolatopsis sacchari TaxID=115433 RepID=UPI003D717AFF
MDGAEKFTEEELAFLRYARFGELPPRPRREDLVETQETEQPWLPTRPRFDPGPEIPTRWC